jgi:hypothetical protein
MLAPDTTCSGGRHVREDRAVNRDRLPVGQQLSHDGHERKIFQVTLRLVWMERRQFERPPPLDRVVRRQQLRLPHARRQRLAMGLATNPGSRPGPGKT